MDGNIISPTCLIKLSPLIFYLQSRKLAQFSPSLIILSENRIFRIARFGHRNKAHFVWKILFSGKLMGRRQKLRPFLSQTTLRWHRVPRKNSGIENLNGRQFTIRSYNNFWLIRKVTEVHMGTNGAYVFSDLVQK